MKRTKKRNMLRLIKSTFLILIIFLLSFLMYQFRYFYLVFNDDANHETPPIITKYINYREDGGDFELPIRGSTGYASILNVVYDQPDLESNVSNIIKPGTGFTILNEYDEWWRINVNGKIGWILHQTCYINLPDIIPSIIYDITNSYSSLLTSSNKEIPNITGKSHYNAFLFNDRFNKEEFILPVIYAMASKIQIAQESALDNGNTLIIIEGYRPLELQKSIVLNLSQLAQEDLGVMEGLTTSPWNIGWFISTSISNHQRGYAVDVTLGKIESYEIKNTGNYLYKKITNYSEYDMPSQIHELSIDSVAFNEPIDSKSQTAWRFAELAETMNNYSIELQKYFIEAGLIPIASEWWHFNDLSLVEILENSGNSGNYFIETIHSITP